MDFSEDFQDVVFNYGCVFLRNNLISFKIALILDFLKDEQLFRLKISFFIKK